MSIVAIAWAKCQRTGSPTLKAVLMAVADYADERGCAWPSQTKLTQDTELSERAVRSALSELASLGFLTREPRRRQDGSRATDILCLHINRQYMPVVRQEVPLQPAAGAAPPAGGAGLELPMNLYSEPNGSGAVAPVDLVGANDPADPKAAERDLFVRGKQVLGKSAGGVIADLLRAKARNVAMARAAIEEASQAENPMEWLQKAMRNSRAPPGRGNPYGSIAFDHEDQVRSLYRDSHRENTEVEIIPADRRLA
jgi:hypothetical protein